MPPTNIATFVPDEEGDFVVKETPYVKPEPREVVIKNAAVAVNPMDWKIKAFAKMLPVPMNYPAIIGTDIAGEVYELGEGVTEFKKGDRVIGMANWFLHRRLQDGGFQHYTVCTSNAIALLPDSIPFVSGCVLPLGISTAAMGLYLSKRLALPIPQATNPTLIGKTLLIWGAASSMGAITVQLAFSSGVSVIATASPKNHAFVKSLGASAVLDYHHEDIVQKLVGAIKEAGGAFAGALDAIGEESTWRACAEVIRALGEAKVVSNRPQGFGNVPEGVEVVGVNDTASIFQDKEICEGMWGQYVPQALEAGTLKAVPEPIVVGRGLERVKEGVELCQKGISAGKAVIEF